MPSKFTDNWERGCWSPPTNNAWLMIENELILELKSVDEIKGTHEVQLLTYMKLAGVQIGLLFNFNKTKLKDGIKRFVL